MRAQNLAVCVPNKGCNKNCPYCVSKMTGYIDSNYGLMKRNIRKVITIAKQANVTSVLFTGKGEPLINKEELYSLIWDFREFPCELQTNGMVFYKENDVLSELRIRGLDVLALSLDSLSQFQIMREVTRQANELGLIVRVTLNITNTIRNDITWKDLIEQCKAGNIRQLSLRRITIPTGTNPENVCAKWIEEHNGDELYDRLNDELYGKSLTFARKGIGRPIRNLPYGAVVYDVDGIAVTSFNYCVQDSHKDDGIRSLIFQEDGHLYTTWNSPASMLF